MSIAWTLGLVLPWGWALVLAVWPGRADAWSGGVALAGALSTAASVTTALVLERSGAPASAFGLVWLSDGLTAMFALLTAWIAVAVTLFATRYLPHAQAEAASERPMAGFYALMSAFTGAMLGLVTAGHVLQLYAFWELTGLWSFLLIGFWHHRAEAREGAARSFMFTTAGGVALLVGLLVMGTRAGAWDMPTLAAEAGAWRGAAWAEPCAALVLAGALAKSAQFPFSAWLAGAMAAPTPASAFLHSSALVAAGVYLVARFFPLLGATEVWHGLLIGAGAVGVLLGGLLALRQEAVKAMLAYSTVSQYALIFLGFGLGTTAGVQAALFAFFVHAPLKAALFLIAGAVAHVSGQTRFADVGGLAGTNPALMAAATVAGLSLGGVPILGGFYYKEELLHAAWAQGAWGLLGAMLLGGMLTLLYMLRFLIEVFLDPRRPAQTPGRVPGRMGLAIAALLAVAVMAGVAPGLANHLVLDAAITAVMGRPTHFGVELEPGGVFLLSLGVLALGAALASFWRRDALKRELLWRLPPTIGLGGRGAARVYTALSERVLAFHDGNLRRYLRLELTAALGLFAVAWAPRAWVSRPAQGGLDAAVGLLVLVSLVAAVATIRLRFHVMAVVALTISGYALAAVFALMHGPDVALAQVLVETLATFSIVLAVKQTGLVDAQRTPMVAEGGPNAHRAALALGVGAVVGVGTYHVGAAPPGATVASWYAREGHAASGMHDLVTAILTQFRALDTVVEIFVFVAAALAVVALFEREGARRGAADE